MAADEKILSKIKKLLNLSTSDNEAEASLAASKAQTLLLQHNISEEELDSFESHKSEKIVEVTTAGKTRSNKSVWYNSLAGIVASANLCKLLTSGPGLIWIGKPTNIEVAQYILENLTRDLTFIADRAFEFYRQTERWPAHGKTWKNNFYFGAIQSINARLNANLTQLREAQPKIGDLVVRNDIELDAYLKLKYPRLVTTHHGYRRERSAFDQGKVAGNAVQFRSGVGAGGSSGPKLLNKGR